MKLAEAINRIITLPAERREMILQSLKRGEHELWERV